MYIKYVFSIEVITGNSTHIKQGLTILVCCRNVPDVEAEINYEMNVISMTEDTWRYIEFNFRNSIDFNAKHV